MWHSVINPIQASKPLDKGQVIAIPISDFLIPLVRPSWHYHPLSYRLITAMTDYYKFSRAVFHWNNLPLETVACMIDHVSPYIYF